MDDAQALAYVRAAAVAAGLRLDDARAQAVAVHFARTAAMAAQLADVPLGEADEPAELFCPAPFPRGDESP